MAQLGAPAADGVAVDSSSPLPLTRPWSPAVPSLRATPWAVVLVSTFAFALVSGGPLGTEFFTRAVVDLGEAFAATAACGVSAVRARRLAGRARAFWLLIAGATGAWALGEVVWSYYELVVGRETPFPSMADVGFLLFPVLAFVGLLLRPSPAYRRGGRARVFLDATMIAAALFVVSWATTLGRVYRDGADSAFSFAVALAYPVTDLVLLVMAAVVVMYSRVCRSDAVLIVGFAAMAVADSGFVYLTSVGTLGAITYVDSCWFAAFALIALSAWLYRAPPPAEGERVEPAVVLVLPYLVVVVGAAVAAVGLIRHGVDPVVLVATCVALTALVSRQLLTILDNRRLARDLLLQQNELRFQAFHDGLTGLANRALFNDRVTHALDLHRRDMRPISMLFCDLDDFKSVNDSLGHDVGDAVLIAVAQRLTAVLRSGDTLARLGGDEFAILLEDDGDTTILSERILQAMAAPIVANNRSIPVHLSIGRTTIDPADGDADVQQLLKQADIAMYAAKQKAKGTAMDYSAVAGEIGADTLDCRIALISELTSGRIGTALQPILRMDGSPYAAEALVRWSYNAAAVPPPQIVTMAESEGMLADLDLLVARNALRATAEMRANDGIGVVTTINLGLSRFVEADVASRLHALLVELRVVPSTLVVEVTERDLLEPAVMNNALAALRDIGVRIAIDDFGVGQSNLSRLGEIAPDIVKLDRTFVAPLDDPLHRPTLVRGIVSLAHDLGALVVGEGVETERQLEALRDLGCDAVQGFLLGRPALVDADPERTASR